MKRIIFAAILTATVLNACQNPEEENTAATQNTTTNTPAPIPGTDTQNAVAAPTATTIPPAPPVVAPVIAPPPPPAPIAGASPKVNPAHGLPGHRCDLQVGAPLPQAGSAPATQAQVVPAAPAGQAGPTVQSIAIPPPPATTGSPISGSKKVNPAHGQPGHRCDIAVGAPLN